MREPRRESVPDGGTDAGTRRRRGRAGRGGSISVSDLLGGQPFHTRPEADGPESVHPHEESRHEPPRDGEDRWLPRPAIRRTVGIAAIVLVLAGGATISTVLARATGSDAPNAATPAAISGSRALRVDLLMVRALPNPPKLTSEEPDRQEIELSLSDLLRENRSSMLRANPSAGSTESSVRLVSEFYELLGENPRAATVLLSPKVAGGEEAEIARGWRAMRSVDTHDVVAVDGVVLGTVTAEDSAGNRAVLRHSFSVTSGSEPRITRVELRAARVDSGRN